MRAGRPPRHPVDQGGVDPGGGRPGDVGLELIADHDHAATAQPAAALGELVPAAQYAVKPGPQPSWGLLRNAIHDGYAPVLEQFAYGDSSWIITPYTHEAIPLGALKDAIPGPLAPLPVAVEIIRELLATLSARRYLGRLADSFDRKWSGGTVITVN